ncbi:MAG: murein biosynthesis integral membrane protein MurJ [Desulfobacteraceae bacterium]|jgi:putative peptidoglycan lipid II flippase
MGSSYSASDKGTKVVKAAGIVGGLTFMSRILGYVRDMVIASFFGASIYTDAFIAAFRIPNLMRRLFGEGSLSVLFIPVFSEYLVSGDKTNAYKLARTTLRLMTVILTIVVILGILFAPIIVKFVAPGFESNPEKFRLTVDLTRIMFPYLLFVGLVALSMAILNTLNHFAAPALAPSLLNIAMISALVIVSFLSSERNMQVFALAMGVLCGGGLQLLLQLPFLLSCGINFKWRGKLFHPGLKRIGRLMLPTVFGSAIYQINILVGTLLASQLAEGSISYLYYADRLVQFPLGIFAVAMGTAILPTLSRQAASQDLIGLKTTFADALCLVFFITLPATVGLIVLREPIVIQLFQRGAFDAQTSQLTADALLYYGIGLWAYSTIRVLLPTFYALQDTWTPVQSGLISIVVNIGLGVILMKPMGHCGLALATALASILNFFLLTLSLRMRLGGFDGKRIVISISKSILCALLMGYVVWQMTIIDWGHLGSFRMPPVGQLCLNIASGVVLFISFAKALSMPEINIIFAILKKVQK